MDISVIGLGKLGAPMATCLAYKGFQVVGVDQNPHTVQLVNEGTAPVFEPGLAALMGATGGRLLATTDCAAAVARTSVTVILVPTPSEVSGEFSLRAVLATVEEIGRALREKDAYHVVALTSTVMPGATGGQVLLALEAASGKRSGSDFGLCYNPEFVALGSVIQNMLNPDFVLIGESDRRAGDMLAAMHHRLCDNSPAVVHMNLINAELTKLAVNTFVTTKISYANMLAEVCEHLPDADVDIVTAALGLDSRIGRKYLQGATSYGGTCFPRDNQAFIHLAHQLGTRALLAEATDRLNREQTTRLADIVLARLPVGGRVGVLGLSFKPNTNVVEESAGVALVRHLLTQGIPIVVYDPVAMDNARTILNDTVVFAGSASECARQADVIVLATPWDEFRRLSRTDLARVGRRPVLIDCWRILDREELEPVAGYVALGLGTTHQASAGIS